MAGEIIKEYLVACGFDVNDAELAKFNGFVERASRTVQAFGKDMLETGLTLGATLEEAARKLEDFYYVAARSNTTVSNLMAVRYAADQVGVGADNMQAAVGGVASALRSNPIGFGGLLAGLGVATTVNGKLRDTVDVTSDIIDRLKTMGGPGTQGFAIAQRYAQMLGIDPDTLVMLERGNEDRKYFAEEFKKRVAESGVNFETLADQSKNFDRNLRTIGADFGIFRGELLHDIIDPAIWATKEIEELFRAFNSTGPGPDKWAAGIIVSMGLWKAAALGLRTIIASLGLAATKAAGEIRAAAVSAGAATGGAAAPPPAAAPPAPAPVAAPAETAGDKFAKTVGGLKTLDPALTSALGLSIAFDAVKKAEAQWDTDFANAKSQYGDHVQELHDWIVRYNHDHPFVEPYGPETANILAPLGGPSHKTVGDWALDWVKRQLGLPTKPAGSETPPNAGAGDLLSPHSLSVGDTGIVGGPRPTGDEFSPNNFSISPGGVIAAPGEVGRRQPAQTGIKPGAVLTPDVIRKYFLDKGYSDAVASGIAAGMMAESSGDPNAVNPKSGAYGLGQDLGPRQAALFAKYGPHPTAENELEYTDLELRGGDPNVKVDSGSASVLAAKTRDEAAAAYIQNFMRPRRGYETTTDINNAASYMKKFRTGHVKVPASLTVPQAIAGYPGNDTPNVEIGDGKSDLDNPNADMYHVGKPGGYNPQFTQLPSSPVTNDGPPLAAFNTALAPSPSQVINIDVNNNNNVTVSGVSDPKEAGNEVTAGLTRVNGNLLRNLQSVTSGWKSGVN